MRAISRSTVIQVATVVQDRFSQVDPGDVAHSQAFVADREVAYRLDVAETCEGPNVVAQQVSADRAEIHVEIGGVDAFDQVPDAHAVLDDCVQIDLDPDLLRLDTVQLDACHPADTLQGPANPAIEQLPGLGKISLGRDPAPEHLGARPAGISLDPDVADALGQPRTGSLHRVANLHLLEIDVRRPLELGLDDCESRPRKAEDPLDPRNRRDLLLDRSDDLAQALERVAAGKRDADVDLGFLHHRHEAQGKVEQGDRAEDRDTDQQHQRRDGSIQRQVRETHRAASPPA
jgi:hypothetical protein